MFVKMVGPLDKFEGEVKKSFDEFGDYIKEPKHVRVLKVIVVLLAFGLVGYVITVNFLISQDFNYFYDMNNGTDYLSPSDRIEKARNHTNLTGHLVYFYSPPVSGNNGVDIALRFFNNLPRDHNFRLGAKNDPKWSYVYHNIEDIPEDSFDEWVTVSESFDIREEHLYRGNNRISFVFYAQYLYYDKLAKPLPVDWINITIHKPGLFEKIGWQDDLDRFFEYIKFWGLSLVQGQGNK
jgi:hypothetical protein